MQDLQRRRFVRLAGQAADLGEAAPPVQQEQDVPLLRGQRRRVLHPVGVHEHLDRHGQVGEHVRQSSPDVDATHAFDQQVLQGHLERDGRVRWRHALEEGEPAVLPAERLEDHLRDLDLEERPQLRLRDQAGRDQDLAQARARRLLVRQRLLEDGLLQLAVPHQERAQPQVVARGGGEDGAALTEVELRLLVAALHGQDPAALGLVEEREQVGHFDGSEIALERLLHGERHPSTRVPPDLCYPLFLVGPAARASRALLSSFAPLPCGPAGGLMTTFKDVIRQVKAAIREVSVEEARAPVEARRSSWTCARPTSGRRATSRRDPHPPRLPGAARRGEGARQGPRDRRLLRRRNAQRPGRAQPAGPRATRTSRRMAGGFGKWKEARPARSRCRAPSRRRSASATAATCKVPEIGEAGQAKLLDSKVLLVGAGGLGSPAGLYLAAAGVGTIGVVDYDVVDRSNLQRQVLHTEASVGRPKTESAAATLTRAQPRRAGRPPRRAARPPPTHARCSRPTT